MTRDLRNALAIMLAVLILGAPIIFADVPQTQGTSSYLALVFQLKPSATPLLTPLPTIPGVPTKTIAPTATATPTPTSTPTVTPVSVTLFTNGDFEQGAVYWQPQTNANNTIITNPPSPVVPRSGTRVARLTATQLSTEAAIDAVDVIVPADKPYLSYWVWIRSTEPTCGDDVGGAGVSLTVRDSFPLCAATQTNGWVNRGLDLSAYAGQAITIEIGAGSFETDTPDSFLFVDDVGWRAVP